MHKQMKHTNTIKYTYSCSHKHTCTKILNFTLPCARQRYKNIITCVCAPSSVHTQTFTCTRRWEIAVYSMKHFKNLMLSNQEMFSKVPLLGKLPAGWMEPWGPSSLFPADPGAFFPEPSAESPLCSFVPICSILSSSHYKQNQTKARRGPGNGCDAHLTWSWWLSSELCPSFQKAACASAARRGPGLQDGGWPAAAPGYGGCSTRCRAQLASPARDRCPAGGAEAPPLPCLASPCPQSVKNVRCSVCPH